MKDAIYFHKIEKHNLFIVENKNVSQLHDSVWGLVVALLNQLIVILKK